MINAYRSLIDNPDLAVGPGHIPTHLPLWYDYMFDDREQRWVSWASLVPRYVPRVNQKFYEIMVPTVDSVRNTWLISLAVQVCYFCYYYLVY